MSQDLATALEVWAARKAQTSSSVNCVVGALAIASQMAIAAADAARGSSPLA